MTPVQKAAKVRTLLAELHNDLANSDESDWDGDYAALLGQLGCVTDNLGDLIEEAAEKVSKFEDERWETVARDLASQRSAMSAGASTLSRLSKLAEKAQEINPLFEVSVSGVVVDWLRHAELHYVDDADSDAGWEWRQALACTRPATVGPGLKHYRLTLSQPAARDLADELAQRAEFHPALYEDDATVDRDLLERAAFSIRSALPA